MHFHNARPLQLSSECEFVRVWSPKCVSLMSLKTYTLTFHYAAFHHKNCSRQPNSSLAHLGISQCLIIWQLLFILCHFQLPGPQSKERKGLVESIGTVLIFASYFAVLSSNTRFCRLRILAVCFYRRSLISGRAAFESKTTWILHRVHMKVPQQHAKQ